MALINGICGALLDAFLKPLAPIGVEGGLIAVSLVTSLVVLLVFRASSDQQQLAAVKRQIQADLFEIRLFRHDLRAMAQAESAVLRHNLRYLTLSFTPVVWLIVPALLIGGQLQAHFAYTGIRPGEPVVVRVQLEPGTRPALDLDAPPSLAVETPAVWMPPTNQIVWRIRPLVEGDYRLTFKSVVGRYEKTLHVGDGLARRSPERAGSGWIDQVFHPWEPPLPPMAPLSAILVDYPDYRVHVFGLACPWLVGYLLLSAFFTLLLRRPLHVVI
jgi:hypothetical protein